MFDDVLIESAGKERQKGAWVSTLLSVIIHVALIGAVIVAGYTVKEPPAVIERPMAAFVVASPPPPPPPPPPGPSTNVASTPTRVERASTEPLFQQPRDVPQELPEVAQTATPIPSTPSEGGMPGGQEGGEIGGIVGGEVGGEKGGVPGGKTGGTLGSSGTLPGAGAGSEQKPVRVGGNVLPPKIVTRVDPQYTEPARRAKIEGIVIIEAVIDRNGNVTEARILKPLSFGLDQQALKAILAWKFQPGTLNGQAIPVYYNLTVHFQID
ncbi:MAG TPA: TonB family protein [Thermoanaerobaculia bacterium]|nr:TonB family protein [Thermoanaerobaculia bacterium]